MPIVVWWAIANGLIVDCWITPVAGGVPFGEPLPDEDRWWLLVGGLYIWTGIGWPEESCWEDDSGGWTVWIEPGGVFFLRKGSEPTEPRSPPLTLDPVEPRGDWWRACNKRRKRWAPLTFKTNFIQYHNWNFYSYITNTHLMLQFFNCWWQRTTGRHSLWSFGTAYFIWRMYWGLTHQRYIEHHQIHNHAFHIQMFAVKF